MCKDEMMECVLCHKKELSKTRCEQGHYVCNECHTKGMDVIIDICLSETSKNPIEIIRRMMAQPFCHMHGPEHHVMVGSALLTAYKNAGGEIDLPEALLEMMNRGKTAPGSVSFTEVFISRDSLCGGTSGKWDKKLSGDGSCKRKIYRTAYA